MCVGVCCGALCEWLLVCVVLFLFLFDVFCFVCFGLVLYRGGVVLVVCVVGVFFSICMCLWRCVFVCWAVCFFLGVLFLFLFLFLYLSVCYCVCCVFVCLSV